MEGRDANREEEHLEIQDHFRRNALIIISSMLRWWKDSGKGKLLVDEIIHSIFFLGKINTAPYTPERIIGNKEMLVKLREKFPRPFDYYLSHVPKRSPFSCVMDMMVLLKGQGNEDQIKQSLRDLINDKLSKKKNKRFLVSTTICVSQKSTENNSVRYYGVSMSAGPNPRRILVAAACCSAWDEYVSDAVMTYYPDTVRKQYFDGTIKLPKGVRCDAFDLSDLDDKDPCKLCRNLFSLQVRTQIEEGEISWPYGNCAEAESLSNLLKNEKEVKEKTQQKSYNSEDRQRAKDSVLDELKTLLSEVKFKWKANDFYNP
ncbi:uncharacterized protein LOC108900371 isoform X1 [Lates calcarifer]|uniref:Uncharacterized protein LOC108900371 isoform X1 n=1 Tax=Lates calcarifer TaxID=8187 RepID=A0AAJ7QIH1_LATCA|nr:uncharacterized protein LOC108900371 isoform X1 [Lates calcarifer]